MASAGGGNELEDDTLRLVLSLLDVRSRCIAACVCTRWHRLLQGVPDAALDLGLEGVSPEVFAGFEAWLVGRLHGLLKRELRSLRLSIASDAFAAHQLRIFDALGGCGALTQLQVQSTSRYSDFIWGGIMSLPPTLQRLDIAHFNLTSTMNAEGEREVYLQHLDRFPDLRWLRVSCMPQPQAGVPSDALWRLILPPGIMHLRQLRYLELSAAFGEFRRDFGLPPAMSCLANLTELRVKVVTMSEGSMATVARLPALAAFRLQCGPPCVPLELAPLSRALQLRSLSLAFDMRARGIDLGQVPEGTQVPVMFDITHLPQVARLRLMIFPDSSVQPSNIFQMHFLTSNPAALQVHQLSLLDLRLANATAVLSLEMLGRLAALRQLRVQAGVLDLQPPFNQQGQPSYRGAGGVMAAWVMRLEGLHFRCERATAKTSAALQAFEMLDQHCIYDCRTIADQPAAGQPAPPPREQQHLWKGDVNAAAVQEWGLEA